ncbi:N-acetylmuramoyl-L-alanine amidase [Gleimia coleocanis DSM 15436]|uniref:N-acetylmuramoyl-L-alanine amidase n=1 Tax=Gleimia coleocanis DSM 15436 TaxID=525245 RepID=C0VZS6_9ACTO|nr:peptidoglycan recognition protein [Gleimia coleocanis]EEH63785.1 N-acetylmuramoyl-L-alanine amidase [Gleimia coleocanis DSM 15436]
MQTDKQRITKIIQGIALATVTAIATTGMLISTGSYQKTTEHSFLDTENPAVLPPVQTVADIPEIAENPAVLVQSLHTITVPTDYAEAGTTDENPLAPETEPASADNMVSTISNETETTTQEETPAEDQPKLKAVQAAVVPVESSVAVAGITWETTNSPAETDITYRVQKQGEWQAWEATEPEPVFSEDEGSSQRIGTEALIFTDIEALEVIVETSDGQPIDGLELSVVEPFLTEGEATGISHTQTEKPKTQEFPYVLGERPEIITRAQWKANPKYLDWENKYAPLKAVVVHHTASSNDYAPEQAPGIVAGIYYYHAKTLNWGDIGYHFLVDKYGKIYQGRDGDINKVNEGGHAFGFNTGTIGISMIGNFQKELPTDAALDSVAKLAAWKLKAAKLDPNADHTEKRSNLKPGHSEVTGKVLDGHRAWNYTACPGDAFYPHFGELRQQVTDLIKGKPNFRVKDTKWLPAGSGAQPPVKPAEPVVKYTYRNEKTLPVLGDLFTISQAGELLNFGGVSMPFGNPVKKGHGWLGVSWFDTTDWDQDGYLDVIAIFKTGELRVYFTNENGIFNRVAQIGHGFGNYKGYLKRDKNAKPLLFTIAPNGDFTRWDNNGMKYVSNPKRIGHGWNIIEFPMIIDYDLNGKTDILALDYAGKLWTYPMDTDRFILNRYQIGHGWKMYNRLTTLHGRKQQQWMVGITHDGKLILYRVTKKRIDRLPTWSEKFSAYRLSGENR